MNKDTIIEKKRGDRLKDICDQNRRLAWWEGIKKNFHNEGVNREIQDQQKKSIR